MFFVLCSSCKHNEFFWFCVLLRSQAAKNRNSHHLDASDAAKSPTGPKNSTAGMEFKQEDNSKQQSYISQKAC